MRTPSRGCCSPSTAELTCRMSGLLADSCSCGLLQTGHHPHMLQGLQLSLKCLASCSVHPDSKPHLGVVGVPVQRGGILLGCLEQALVCLVLIRALHQARHVAQGHTPVVQRSMGSVLQAPGCLVAPTGLQAGEHGAAWAT